jgi:hypothetical protein
MGNAAPGYMDTENGGPAQIRRRKSAKSKQDATPEEKAAQEQKVEEERLRQEHEDEDRAAAARTQTKTEAAAHKHDIKVIIGSIDAEFDMLGSLDSLHSDPRVYQHEIKALKDKFVEKKNVFLTKLRRINPDVEEDQAQIQQMYGILQSTKKEVHLKLHHHLHEILKAQKVDLQLLSDNHLSQGLESNISNAKAKVETSLEFMNDATKKDADLTAVHNSVVEVRNAANQIRQSMTAK